MEKICYTANAFDNTIIIKCMTREQYNKIIHALDTYTDNIAKHQ